MIQKLYTARDLRRSLQEDPATKNLKIDAGATTQRYPPGVHQLHVR